MVRLKKRWNEDVTDREKSSKVSTRSEKCPLNAVGNGYGGGKRPHQRGDDFIKAGWLNPPVKHEVWKRMKKKKSEEPCPGIQTDFEEMSTVSKGDIVEKNTTE